MKCRKGRGNQKLMQRRVVAIFSRTFHTYPICLPNFNFGKKGDGEVTMLYPKRNWENYQILYSLKVRQRMRDARFIDCTIYQLVEDHILMRPK